MPEWITGSELLKRCDIHPYDLLIKYIKAAGLQPYNYAERPLSPVDAMAEVLDAKLAKADHTPEAHQCEGYSENEDEVLIFHTPRSKFQEISNIHTLKSPKDIRWCDFVLPEDYSETNHLMLLLKQSLYLLDEVKKLCPLSGKPSKKENNQLPEHINQEKITWLPLKQLSEITNISVYKLRNYIKKDGMPYKAVGKKKFVVNPIEFHKWFSNFEDTTATNNPDPSIDDLLDEVLE